MIPSSPFILNPVDRERALIARHFNATEFACPHCKAIVLDPCLLLALVWLRDLINAPVKVNSGYRCPIHNAAVGGAPQSQHILGRAADVQVAGLTSGQLAEVAASVPYFRNGGIITMAAAVHLDVRGVPFRGSK